MTVHVEIFLSNNVSCCEYKETKVPAPLLENDDPAASAPAPSFQPKTAALQTATMTPFLTYALALSMPVLSMAAAVTKPVGQTKPFGLDTRQDETEIAPTENIVGGTTASAGDFPFIVSLSKSNSHFCGGLLLNANTVVTAAHCTVGQTASTVKVRAGSLVSYSSAFCFLLTIELGRGGLVSHPLLRPPKNGSQMIEC